MSTTTKQLEDRMAEVLLRLGANADEIKAAAARLAAAAERAPATMGGTFGCFIENDVIALNAATLTALAAERATLQSEYRWFSQIVDGDRP